VAPGDTFLWPKAGLDIQQNRDTPSPCAPTNVKLYHHDRWKSGDFDDFDKQRFGDSRSSRGATVPSTKPRLHMAYSN